MQVQLWPINPLKIYNIWVISKIKVILAKYNLYLPVVHDY